MNRFLRIIAGLFCLFFVLSCTEAKLEKMPAEPPPQRDDKLALSGALCTERPETLTFPLRVIFIVDGSSSMTLTDPPDPISGETGRERAVRETWSSLLDQGAAGVRFSVIRFTSSAQPLTGVDLNGDGADDTFFTADRTRLAVATETLGLTDGTTNYINALGEAYYQIRKELTDADKESLPLSKYQVVFLSDGLPDVDANEPRENSNENIMAAVRSLRELSSTFKVGEFEFHTAYLASGNNTFDEQAAALLQAMAEEGGGNFRSFPNGEQLSFLHIDFTVLRRIFTLKTLVGLNLNAVQNIDQIPDWAKKPAAAPEDVDAGGSDADAQEADAEGADHATRSKPVSQFQLHPHSFTDIDGDGYPGCGEPLSDSDGDGLADMAELELGTDPFLADTDDDGLSDFFEWQYRDSGFDPLDPGDSTCFVPDICQNRDENGYCDCLSDSNADGICDCVDDPALACVDDAGHDCIDMDEDGFCDCPDLDGDGFCDYPDTDNDGLHDCEEVFYGAAQNGVDSDADGLPDPVEIRFGSNPIEHDLSGDLDADNTSNGIEVKSNTNPVCDDSKVRSRVAVQYTLNKRNIVDGQTCYDFEVQNLTLMPTLGNPDAIYPGNGWNRVLLYAGSVAFDAPNSFPRYRVACVMANYYPDGNYKNPPSGRVLLSESDFVEVADFDPDEHCKWP